MTFDWLDDDAPPAPLGVVAFGDDAPALLARLQRMLDGQRDDQATLPLRATAHRDALVVLGGADALPWLDGVRYIAPRPEAPMLWLPTHQRPSLPLDLLAAAVLRRHARSPLLLWPGPAQLLPLDRARPIDATLLSRIAARWSTG